MAREPKDQAGRARLNGRPQYLTRDQILREQPGITWAQLNNWIHKRGQNGLGEHVKKIGTRLLIDYNGFLRWIDEYCSVQPARPIKKRHPDD